MQPSPGDYVVLTFSPQPSIADFLKRIADEAGFASQAVSTLDDLQDAVTHVAPDAIMYEVGYPFGANWEQLTRLRDNTLIRHVPFVITTPDAHELYRRVGVPALELFRKPDNPSVVRDAVLNAINRPAYDGPCTAEITPRCDLPRRHGAEIATERRGG